MNEEHERMKIEELIEQLESIKEERGNIPVGFNPEEIKFDNHVKTVTGLTVENPSAGSWHMTTAKLEFTDDY